MLTAAYGLGHLVLRRLKLSFHAGEGVFFALSLGLGVLSLSTLLLGSLGLLFPWIAWALLLGGLITAWRTTVWRQRLPTRPRLALHWPTIGQLRGPLGWFGVLLAVVLLWSFLFALLGFAVVPPLDYDEVAYHLALPKLYIEHHRIVCVPFILQSNWPMNAEMLFTLALLLGSDILPHLIILTMSVLMGYGIFSLSRRHFDARVGMLGAALYASTPLVRRLSGSGLIDIALVSYIFAAVYAFALWMESERRGWLLIAGLLAGLAAGTKLTGAAFAVLWSGVVLWDSHSRLHRAWSTAARDAAWFGLIAFVVVVPWYLRSYIFTGNPVWPFFHGILGGKYWDALGTEYLISFLTRFKPPLSLRSLLFALWMVPRDYGGLHLWLFIPTLLPLAMVAVGRGAALGRYLLTFCLGFYIFWLLVLGDQTRFLLPIVAPLALPSAYTIYWWFDRLPHPIGLLGLIMVAILLARDLPVFAAAQRDLLRDRWPYLRGQVSREAFLRHKVDPWEVFVYANERLDEEAVILLLPYECRGYYLDRAYIWGNPIGQRVIKFEQFDDPVALWREIRAMGVTHIIDDPHWVYTALPYWEHDRHLMLQLEAVCAEPLYEENDMILFRVKECCGDSSL